MAGGLEVVACVNPGIVEVTVVGDEHGPEPLLDSVTAANAAALRNGDPRLGPDLGGRVSIRRPLALDGAAATPLLLPVKVGPWRVPFSFGPEVANALPCELLSAV